MLMSRPLPAIGSDARGFTLVETLIALFILVFGLMAAGEVMALAANAASLARSKGSAAIVAESKLVNLMDLHRRNPEDADLALGDHGPEEIEIWNRAANRILNRYKISWTVARVPDPRPRKQLDARQVWITVTPADAAGKRHVVSRMNKEVFLFAVLSGRLL